MFFFFYTKPACNAGLLLDTNLGADTQTLTSLRSKLLHGTSLETYEPRSYFSNSNLASLGATTWYKTRDIWTYGLLNSATRGIYRSSLLMQRTLLNEMVDIVWKNTCISNADIYFFQFGTFGVVARVPIGSSGSALLI